MRVAIVHDHLVHLAGGERVVLAMAKAFPGAPIYTSLFDPQREFPAFRDLDVRPSPLSRFPPLRWRHRWAMPFMARTFARMRIDADVLLCTSAGWAHGVVAHPPARKIVYCFTPARWLYQTDRYIGDGKPVWRAALAALRPTLEAWDKRAAASAHRYIAISRAIRDRVRDCYGLDADVIPAPQNIDPSGPTEPLQGLAPGYLLCVARLLPYKNVRQVVEAMVQLPAERLVIVGTGPEEDRVKADAPPNVRFVGNVSEETLRWLYRHCSGVVAAAYEDFGLSPVEAAAFGKPSAVLRWGGYLDTVVESRTGVYFDEPRPDAIAAALRDLRTRAWESKTIQEHASSNFAEDVFIERIQRVVAEEAAVARQPE